MYKTAESVSPKHPDKLCDQISDAILDACLVEDKYSRVAVETMGGHGLITITGEVTTKANFDPVAIARRLAGDQFEVKVNIIKQSSEIAQGVDGGGAGDQGIMVGYACDETPELLPLEVKLSRELCKLLYGVYDSDGKTQITVEDNEILTVVASFQNSKKVELETIIKDWLKDKEVSGKIKIYANPAGDWDQGGFDADTGVTGRKLIVDNYGPRIPIGGGAFSGKDSTKVDRSSAYMARKVAVNYLKRRQAREVHCYLAYSIGVAEPVMAEVIIDGVVEKVVGYDLRPQEIIRQLQLRTANLEKTARWGHFGEGFVWDKVN